MTERASVKQSRVDRVALRDETDLRWKCGTDLPVAVQRRRRGMAARRQPSTR
jgi:hypothetical protein